MNFPQGYRNKKAKLKDGAKNRQIYLINEIESKEGRKTA
jgi:hypothetical protein